MRKGLQIGQLSFAPKACENLKKKIERTRLRIKAVKDRTAKEKPNTVYKVDFVLAARIMKVNANTLNLRDSRGEDRSIIETISDAMAGDRKSLPLIFRSTDEALEQNWMLMSEWDRIEKANKEMARSI